MVNEFIADNDSSASDQYGDFDDWIELYNNTDKAINLENYYLCDTSSFEHKWELPNVSIEANGYLIIWADKDIDQPDLHT